MMDCSDSDTCGDVNTQPISQLHGNHKSTQTADTDECTLVAVSQACEAFASSPDHDLPLGVVTISPTRATLTSLRLHVCHHLPTLPPKFAFLTPDGSPISKQQEATISVAQILSAKKVVRICRKFDKPRVGIRTLEGASIGFVFADHITTVSKLRNIIADQLGSITTADGGGGYQFVDSNAWPVAESQESSVGLMDILVNSCVRICPQVFKGGYKCLQSGDEHVSQGLMLTDAKRRKVETREFQLPHSPNKLQVKQLSFRSSKDQVRQPSMDSLDSTFDSKQILISYVRQEASQLALDLKQALSRLNYSVYLDVHEIKSGIDWQDALNFAVTNCEVFIPLVTQRYGETLWTNREVKLADVMNKLIVPVNFLTTPWPPKCLAIQFATTQFTAWKNPTSISCAQNGAIDGMFTWPKEDLEWTAVQISERVRAYTEQQRIGSVCALGRRVSILRNYPSQIPEQLSQASRVSDKDREGPPLIVISVHPKQAQFAEDLKSMFKKHHYDVWCTTELEPVVNDSLPVNDEDTHPFSSQASTESQDLIDIDSVHLDSRIQFQEQADEACVVIFVLSKAFAASKTCQQQVFYCEHRKRVIPLHCEDFAMPSWMSMLIGTGYFEDARAKEFHSSLLKRVRSYADPATRDRLSLSTDDELQIAKTARELKAKLGKGVYVYVSGGVKFYHKDTETICKHIGKYLAHLDDIHVVTGGFFGVQETIGESYHCERIRMNVPSTLCHILPYKDGQDRKQSARQNKDLTFQIAPYGETEFAGNSVREREIIVSRIFDICILIEGGPGAAHEAEQFIWNDHVVIPVSRTGGAAGGKFNVPDKIFQLPVGVKESDWAMLSDKKCSIDQTAQAVARIVTCVRERLRLDSPSSRAPNENPFNSPSAKLATENPFNSPVARVPTDNPFGNTTNASSANCNAATISGNVPASVHNTSNGAAASMTPASMGAATMSPAFTALRNSPRRRTITNSLTRTNTFILEHDDE